jgi:hypothetical protein
MIIELESSNEYKEDKTEKVRRFNILETKWEDIE